MRLHFAVLLAVATLLTTTTSADSTVVAPQLPNNDVVETRLLRAVTVGVDDEDRGINPSVSSLESITNLLKSPNQKKLDSLVESGLSTNEAFSHFRLDLIGPALLKKSNSKLWVKYVNKVTTNPQTVVLSKLTSHFGGDGDLAVALQQASRIGRRRRLPRTGRMYSSRSGRRKNGARVTLSTMSSRLTKKPGTPSLLRVLKDRCATYTASICGSTRFGLKHREIIIAHVSDCSADEGVDLVQASKKRLRTQVPFKHLY
ncbi:hypothetical protein ON010_g15632 [Phytophthora cinnamomi]|nr:hypothetical protein ON010_g15632 [Phytophthora cinnamomi]